MRRATKAGAMVGLTALLAAPAWFVGTLHLTRRSRPLVRVGWLALGLGVLLPWPILFRFVAALNFVGSVS